jgi:hypothetical protein
MVMGFVWVAVLLGVVGMPLLTALGLYRSGLAAGLAPSRATAVAVAMAVGWFAWVVVAAVLAGTGAYQQRSDVLNPWIGLTLLAVVAALLLLSRVPVVSRVLAEPGTPARLAVPQVTRVVGGTFVVLFALGQLPAAFALPAGLGDVAVGAAALFVAAGLRRDGRTRRAVWFNVLGIVDLVVAVTMGTLSGLGPFRLDVTPSTQLVAELPLSLIPTTAVPLAIALHIVSLARLRSPVSAPARGTALSR